MAPQVEASSLSDIIHLAANPPKYPRNPTETARQSLVLYIARVPGSQDIILTTLKPQLKNVTAADVASSLYYLHLDTEDDERLLTDGLGPEVPSPATHLAKPLPRKPLPDSARSSIDLQPSLFTSLTPEPITKYMGVPPDALPREPPRQYTPDVIPRRPLAPRAPPSDASIGRKPLPSLPSAISQPRIVVAPADSPLSQTPNRSYSPVRPELPMTNSFNSVSSIGSKFSNEVAPKDFSITVIRRDPSSGGQWNIGKVFGQPLLQDGRKAQQKKCNYSMTVHLSTPGYNWFRDPATSQSSNGSAENAGNAQNAVNPMPVPSPSAGFCRQIQMERSNFWDRTSKQQKRESLDVVRARSDFTHTRSSSEASGMASMIDEVDPSDTNNSRANGYVFTSPWGGRCTFGTKSGGRTLSCKHTLPDRGSSTNTYGGVPTTSAPLSELRFNLPASALFKSAPRNDGHPKSRFGHIKSKLSADKNRPPLPPRPHPTSYAAMYPSDDEDEDDSRLDLSIGQEKAGGGNRGKRAKLGKLIIHDEGLKMLDLVVAANMSVWWSVWESGQQ
ncbi:hypothetical protein BP6252_09350 [Coleophoma cylindrospora]|uniref:Oxidoreductase-like protein n=1 Tax=Coleophoma cylindrospora TaxID=1849047 RepID=A0A3D8R299_9HELO|nr:hypothetical protein BP6252_09350 [Coleophoma cylindrospora]